jgi:hypothetical protein
MAPPSIVRDEATKMDHKRNSNARSRKEKKNMKNIIVGKDLDFLKGKDLFLRLTAEEKDDLLEMMIKDVEFLTSLGVMDYSVLLGVSDHDPQNVRAPGNYRTSRKIVTKRQIVGHKKELSISIIDFLQYFDNYKKIEAIANKLFFGNKASSLDPVDYGHRLLNFMNWIIQEDEE